MAISCVFALVYKVKPTAALNCLKWKTSCLCDVLCNAYSACLRIKTWVEGQSEEKIKYRHFNELG